MSDKSKAFISIVVALGSLFTAASARAESPAFQPPCGPQATAPIAGATIPANAPGLAFVVHEGGGNVVSITLKASDGTAVESMSNVTSGEVAFGLRNSLGSGKTYVVESDTKCAPSSRPPSTPVSTFSTTNAVPLPTSLGRFTQGTQSLGATASPSETPTLILEADDAVLAFLPVVRFTIADPSSTDPGLTTEYGARVRAPLLDNKITIVDFLPAFCSTRPGTLRVRGFMAGQKESFAEANATVDIGAFCDEQDRLRAEAAQRNASSPNESDGGCSVAAPHASSQATTIAIAVAALLVATRRRRSAR